jgi:uncharacterized protein YxjI
MSTRYKIRQKMFSIGDDFWIENQEGERVFKVDGKALRLRETLFLRWLLKMRMVNRWQSSKKV